MKTLWIILWLMLALVSEGAVTIGTESRTNTPGDADYSSVIYTRPANGSTNLVNPPIQSWLHSTNLATLTMDESTYWPGFQLQISGTNTFENFFVNLRTPSNLENRLAPFTNSDGSHYTGVLYRRILYVGTNGLTNFVGATNSFYISPNATNWNRSILRDETKLASFTHPYLLITPTNRAAAQQFLLTNDATAWVYVMIYSNAAVTSDWWTTNYWPTNFSGETFAFPGAYAFEPAVRGKYLGNMLLIYSLTQDTGMSNRLVQQFTNMVEWFHGVEYASVDYGSAFANSPLFCVAYGYDQLYSLL
jgi:hypothetical protein